MERPKALGFLGGSFDPIHKGHLHLAQEVRRTFNLDKIVLIPNAHPPHKAGNYTSYADRLKMSALALQALNHRQYEISTLEQDAAKAHYTADTLKLLRLQYGPEARLFFIMGMDSLLTLDTWHEGLTLTDSAHLAVLLRPGYTLNLADEAALSAQLKAYLEQKLVTAAPDSAEFKAAAAKPCGRIFIVHSREYAVSSTQLRADLAALNQSAAMAADAERSAQHEVKNMLTAPVLRYITAHQLYKTGGK